LRRIFIGSHSLPPPLVRRIGPSLAPERLLPLLQRQANERLLPLRQRQANRRLLPLRQLRANDYFTYSGSALRSSACIDCVRPHQLWSLTMGDNGNSGDAVTQTSTGYFLNQMFMFISCIIMNIVMFNCGLNIHTCTWIVSLTIILKCLLNYGIKICQNVAYHLTMDLPRASAQPWIARALSRAACSVVFTDRLLSPAGLGRPGECAVLCARARPSPASCH
jgi:hypothetical protein